MANSLLYIAIDFGTSFSGYAFSFTKDIKDTIRVSKWTSENGERTPKTPTCILFDEYQKFLKFGYEAVMAYTRSTPKTEEKKQFLFEHFKMELYDKEIHRDLMITAKNGGQMKALTVFSESLRYLKDHALDKIMENTTSKKFIASDVTWVLTVPAIWNAAAKQFMREAAVEAGLVTESEPDRLIFALEPEAASVYCMQLPKDGFIAEEFSADTLKKSTGTQYMVVDCGGGTIDITVHEVVEEGHLKELHAASGNDMGGQTVDQNIISIVKDVFTEKVYRQFEQAHPSSLLKLKWEIALLKSCNEDVTIWCPVNLHKLDKDRPTIENLFEGCRWDDGAIIIDQQRFRKCFDNSFTAIENSIKKILKNKELRIEFLLLVGGYSQSPALLEFIKTRFGSKHKILCPAEPQVAILRGAIMFGRMTTVVKSRISTLTYGFGTNVCFDESIHKGKSKYVNSLGQEYCDVVFEKLVSKGESVLCNEPRQFIRFPVDPTQTSMVFRFYSSESMNVKYVDELGVEHIGSVSVGMPDTSKGMNRRISLAVQFGSTEMKATATNIASQQTESIKLDFISK